MKSIKLSCISAIAILSFSFNAMAQTYNVESPDGSNRIEVFVDGDIKYKVMHGEETILQPSSIDISIDGSFALQNLKVKSTETNNVDKIIEPVIRVKRAEIKDQYNELIVNFINKSSVHFRAYNDGVAYRIETNSKKEVTIDDEIVEYNLTENFKASFPIADGFFTHYERNYTTKPVNELQSDEMSCLPALVQMNNNVKVAITESDLYNYPGFYLVKGADNSLKSVFPKYPKTYTQPDDRDVRPAELHDYIAKTSGKRTFPWRLMVISDNDGDLIQSELVYKLARPLELNETDWIKPGKVAWDWYNANNIYGVDFESGINTPTYKYYIDFASKYGLEYIILDEGWYDIKTNDLLNPVADIQLEELIAYGEEKNVGIILWVSWKALEDQFDEALQQFEDWRVKGIKVDFMQRDDQWMVEYYEKVSRVAAEHKLLVDFHGSYKPSGLRRAYPNVLSREGVKGLEQHKWEGEFANPDYDVEMPFIRMLAGPVDYTPGAMINAQKKNYYPFFERPMSLGTRCHQLAMYVIYESPLQMLADSPSNYLKEEENMKFLSAVPSVWDETVVLSAKFGDHVALARQSGDDWYVGVLGNWTAKDIELDCSFLSDGKYTIELYQDGINAERYASDYKIISRDINNKEKIKVHLASGGGWAARIIRK